MNWKDRYVRVAKIGVQDNPTAPTPLMQDYQLGEINRNVSIPLSYWLEGFMLTEPEAGSCLLVDRRIRNGVEALGTLQTTLILSTEEQGKSLIVKTRNSVYLVTPVEGKETWTTSAQPEN